MFTGLVRGIGTLRSVTRIGGVMRLRIDASASVADLELGDSLAVNGICLTLTGKKGQTVVVEAATETRRVTTLERWRSGDQLHLEPALRAGQSLDGHLVQGHVDGVGQVAGRRRRGGSLFMTVTLPGELARYLVPKGSIAVDGVSLTTDADGKKDRFTVNLIPHTLKNTLFDRMAIGCRVNIEMDVMVKAALRAAATEKVRDEQSVTMEGLLARGFRRRR